MTLEKIAGSRKLFKSGQCTVAENGRGIVIQGDILIQEWAELLDEIAAYQNSIQWILGDLLAYGSLKYDPKKYRIIIEQTGRKYSTVNKWGNVASKFPHEERCFDVSFTHYEQTAFIPKEQRVRLLERAEIEKWTVEKLRDEVVGLSKVIEIAANDCTSSLPSVVIGQKFEEYVGTLLEKMFPDHAWEHLGALKQQERGLDFVGRPIGTDHAIGVIGVQVKCHAPKQTPNDIEWISFLAGCFTRGVDKAYFFSTGKLSSNQLREVSESRQVVVLCGKEITRIASKYNLPAFEINC